jgi:acyl carrier protein
MSEKVDFEKVKKEVKEIVSQIAEIPEEQLKEDARFVEDLGIDSMMALEVVASIEKKYKVVIPEEEIPVIRSLQNVYDLLEKLLKKK